MIHEDGSGVEMLRDAVETVADDLERHRGSTAPRRSPIRRRAGRLALAFGAAAALLAVGYRLSRPGPPVEVQILELKIQGRSVRGIVVDDRASGSLVVMPQVPGPPVAAASARGGRP